MLDIENFEINLEISEKIGKQISEIYYTTDDKSVYQSLPPHKEIDDLMLQNTIFDKCQIKADVDLGEIKVNLTIEGSSKPIDSTICQIFLKREFIDFEGKPGIKWENITPKNDKGYLPFSIYINDSQTFSFDLILPIGKYTQARIIFFADGWKVLADSTVDVIPFEIITNQIRIKRPMIEIYEDKIICPNENNKIIVPFILKFPAGMKPPYNAWWAMAKGGFPGVTFFQQKWLAWGQSVNGQIVPTSICKISDGLDKFWYIESFFEFDYPNTFGLCNLQFGVFDNNWKEAYHWVWPGTDLEIGGDSWMAKCPSDKLPPRLRVKEGHFVKLDGTAFNFYEGTKGSDAISAARGASWGNAYGWTTTPAFNRSGFFASLRFLGHRICRFLFDPDKYTSSLVYRHRILDSIHKILIGGMYPLVGPHNLHVNVSSPAERDKKFLEMCEMIANDWKGLPIMYAIASEPKELTGGWAECKPLWEKAINIIRAIDPEMFIIVPCHGFSKTSTAPEAAELIDKTLVDAYSYHPYHSAAEALPNMKPLLDTGVGIIIEEYGCGNVTWQKSMNIQMQKISKLYPNLLAFLTWAWTKNGQDACPMVENGDLANITLTESGKMQALDIAVWDSGNYIDESGSIVLPPVTGDGNVDTGGSTSGGITTNLSYTKQEIDDLLNLKLNDLKTNLESLLNENFKLMSDKINLFSDKIDVFKPEIPFLLIQQYLTALADCKLLAATTASTIIQLKKGQLTISLTRPAPQGGALVFIVPTVTQILVQSSVLIPEGQNSTVVEFTSIPISAQTAGKIVCTFNGKTISTASITIKVK